jgi:hypothetical protein
MAETKLVGVRIPNALLKRVEAVKGEDTLSQTVIKLIEKGLGLEPDPEAPEVLERLAEIERMLAVLDKRLTTVEQNPQAVKQRSTPVKQPVKQRSTGVKQMVDWKAFVAENPGLGLSELTDLGVARYGKPRKVTMDNIRRALPKP